MLSEVITGLVLGESITKEQIQEALEALCELHNDSCDHNCPIFLANAEAVPMNGLGKCICANDGQKMYAVLHKLLIHTKYAPKVAEVIEYCTWTGYNVHELTSRCGATLSPNAVQEELEFIDGTLYCIYCGRPMKFHIPEGGQNE